jgi:hypothetical protein
VQGLADAKHKYLDNRCSLASVLNKTLVTSSASSVWVSLARPRAINSADRLTRLDAILYASSQTAATWLTIQPYAAIKIGPIPDLLIGRVAGIVMVNVQIGEAKP